MGDGAYGLEPKRKWSDADLTYLALVYAEANRREVADAAIGDYGQEQMDLAEAMRSYRLKRWG